MSMFEAFGSISINPVQTASGSLPGAPANPRALVGGFGANGANDGNSTASESERGYRFVSVKRARGTKG